MIVTRDGHVARSHLYVKVVVIQILCGECQWKLALLRIQNVSAYPVPILRAYPVFFLEERFLFVTFCFHENFGIQDVNLVM